MSKIQRDVYRMCLAQSLLWTLGAYAPLIVPSRAIAQSPAAIATLSDSKVAEPASDAQDGDVPDPELVALAWQYRPQAGGPRLKQPVWRPDGTRLSDVETNALLDDVKNFQGHWWQKEQLPPLVMIFRRAGPIKSGVSAAIVRADGRRLWGGTWGPIGPSGLAKTACAPQLSELARWPESVDLDVKVPLEDPQIIKTITEITDGPVEVASGVRWYIDNDRGIEFKRGGEQRAHLTAAVLEVENESSDDLVVYNSSVRLRGEQLPLRGGYGQIIGRPGGVFATLRVSAPLDDVKLIEKVEFTRQRFKVQRINGVKLRLDLLLPLEDDRPNKPITKPTDRPIELK